MDMDVARADNGFIMRILFCVAILSIPHGESKPEAVTCMVRPADSGQRAVVCYFPFDLSTTKNTFALFQILSGKTDNVVTCNFFEEKVFCQIKEGFMKPNVTSNMATFLVPRDDMSSFFCNTVPAISTVRAVNCSVEIGASFLSVPALPTTPDTIVTDKDKREKTSGLSTVEIAMCVIVPLVIIFLVAVLLVGRPELRQKLVARCFPGQSDERARENRPRERENKPQDGEQELLSGVSQDVSDGLPDWCQCGHCRNMPTERERICCNNTPCLSTTQKFLDMLEKAKVWEPKTPEFLDGKVVVTSKWRRYEFYKQFVELYYGRLGKGQKSPVYSCCVWAVRNTFPEEDGQYTGFVEGSMVVHSTKDWNQKYEHGQASKV